MKANPNEVTCQTIAPVNGKIRIKFIPKSLAQNSEYMKRHGLRVAEIAVPEPVSTSNLPPIIAESTPALTEKRLPFQIEDSTNGKPAKRKYTKRNKKKKSKKVTQPQ